MNGSLCTLDTLCIASFRCYNKNKHHIVYFYFIEYRKHVLV